MSDIHRITRAETIGSAALWYGVLGPPLVWAGQLLLDYGLTEAVACAPGSHARATFAGVGIKSVIQITNSVAAALTVLAILLSWRCYRRLRGSDQTNAARARWMAQAGLFVGTLFLIVTGLKFAAPAFLSPCGYSP